MSVLKRIGVNTENILVFENTYFSLFLYLVCDDNWKRRDFLIFGDRIAPATLTRLRKYANVLQQSEQFMPKPMPRIKHGVRHYFGRKRAQKSLFEQYDLCIGNVREINNWTIKVPRIQIEDGISTRNALVKGDRNRGILGLLLLKEPEKMAKIDRFVMAEQIKHPLDKFASKIEWVDFFALWEQKSIADKADILDVLDVDVAQFNEIDVNYSILFTQAWSEITEGYSEQDKVAGYQQLVKELKIDETRLVIKPHPKEKTDYSRYFPKAIILKPSFPSELMPLLNVRVDKVVSVASTACACFKGFANEIVYVRAPEYFAFPRKLADHLNQLNL
ncbi:glycosyltransferase family 52 [Shewanella halifaxensis]|uniref:glycosyltransferase family 52 n=1 Tax=Shewanella halifaxensis TaxID=271098 RepID=UPI000D59AEA0|nr:glycosyltransferase family 52 [Shewanella halifaxensis]